ncbi:MAG: signal peptidase I [Chloroflexi bacterium]|nr:signal peptidase I [Chloroflexota bacterium]
MINFLVSLLFISIFCVFIILYARKRFMLIVVSGGSMFPTMQEGDRLLVLRCHSSHPFKVGQIIMANPPYPGKWREKLYIKQLVGLPRDKVTISFAELNPQIHIAVADYKDKEGNRTWYVPDGYCFVQGDSYWSEDCRAWGPIPLNSLVGVVRLKLPRRPNQPDRIIPIEINSLSTKQAFMLTEKEAE